jgi:ABC-type transport system involved in multi-copper enzyme maturation permease subunit
MGTPAEPVFLLDRKWPFRIAVGFWLAIGLITWFVAGDLDRPAQVILAGLWVVGIGLLVRQFLRSLFGPVLAYDVFRVGRKPRQIWFRIAYVVGLAVILGWVYLNWYWNARYRGGVVRPANLSRLAEMFFTTYMIIQFILVCVLTPSAVAGAIADEKERRTLEFLLATDLRDREILFGKLASRVGSLLLFLLAGLPVLGLMQFFGGIDPDLVIAGFAATFATVLTLAALGIAASVLSRRARDAIALTYLLAIVYVMLSGVAYAVAMIPDVRDALTFDLFGYTIKPEDLTYPIIAGNPFFMVPDTMFRRGAMTVDLFRPLSHYLLFHAVVIALLVTWAGFNLRPIALRQTFGSRGRSLLAQLRPKRKLAEEEQRADYDDAPARPRRARPVSTRPPVGEQPILWKEVFVDAGLKLGGFGRVVILGLVGLSFVPAGFIFYFTIVDPPFQGAGTSWWLESRWREFGQGMNIYLRSAGTVATCLVFLAVAIRGAGALSGERDRHTLDALLTTPLSVRAIVWGKWWGCLLGMRWAWAWLLALWVLALATGGVHPVMFPFAVIAIAVYAGAFAWIGIFCSVQFRTSLRSVMAAIVTSVFLSGGYFLVFALCCVMPLEMARAVDNRTMRLPMNVLCGFSPPVCVAWLPIREFKNDEVDFIDHNIPFPPFWVIGLVGWAGLSVALAQTSVSKFRQMANRVPIEPEPQLRRGPPPLPKRPIKTTRDAPT